MSHADKPSSGLVKDLTARSMDASIDLLRKVQGLDPEQARALLEAQSIELDPERAMRTTDTGEWIELPGDVVEAIRANQPLQALQSMKTATGLSLKQSRRLIEAFCEQHDLPPPFSNRVSPAKAIIGTVVSIAIAYIWNRYMR